MDTEEKTYLKGFNAGYKLAKFQPDLFERLKESLSEENEYDRGIIEGGAEAEREREKERQDELNQINDGQEQDIER